MGSRLLIVDDDRILVDALRELLLRRFPAANIETCTSADQSTSLIAREDYDVIISDVRMPGTDGLQLLERAHELRPETPIVLITGLGDYDLAVKALRGGAFDFITKPVDTDYLAASVSRALRVREVARELHAQKQALAEHAAALAHIVDDQTRELREANRIKDEFLATLSHELRTPLTAMLGWARLLLRSELDDKTRTQAIEAIERNAGHQARLVDDLLDVSRIMSGKLRLSPRTVQLGRLVGGVIDTLAQQARGRDLVFERDLDMTDAGVHGDADRLQQVVSNLLSNAVKFTPDGGRITTRVRRERDHVVLTVTDTGVGVLGDFLPRVFERFRQADASLARSRGGLGVGLAIVKHIVELHGGTVAAASDGKDHGATFTVRLPAIDAVREVPPLTGGEASPESLNGVLVLLVEDDSDARRLLRFTLEQSGARVIDVESAAGAMTELDRAIPDVILCDISMPQEDGYSLIRRIRARKPQAGGRVPSVAVTAYARPEDVRHALAAGFDLHLAKPLEPRDLIAAVVRLAHDKPRAAALLDSSFGGRNSPT
ncbi:MAG TPA: response regulator [Polyangiaceae bacterium]